MSSSKPEKVEEKKFYAKIDSHGWECIKLMTAGPYGRAGRNDRLVLASYAVTAFFEFKRIGEDAEKLQSYYHEKLQKLGFETHVVYTCDEAYKILMALVRKAKAVFEAAEFEKEIRKGVRENWNKPTAKGRPFKA